MKTSLILTAAILVVILSSFANAAIVITKVYSDPIATETGGEAVEIYNTGPDSASIGGWTLRTKSSAADVTFPAGAIIMPGDYFLIADANWNASRDNESWRNAEHEEAMTLTNSDGGLALIDSNGTSIDAIGWGSAVALTPDIYEGTPHPAPAQGMMLKRTPQGDGYADSGNNSADFTSVKADFRFHAPSSPNSSQVQVTINITESPLKIAFAQFTEDDFSQAGTQIVPSPGRNRTVLVTIGLDADSIGDVDAIEALVFGKSKAAAFIGTQNTTLIYSVPVTIPYHQPAGSYAIDITAQGADGSSDQTTLPFEISELIALSMNDSDISLQGSHASADIRIANLGNRNLDIGIRSSAFSSEKDIIEAGSLGYALISDAGSPRFDGVLSEQQVVLDLNLGTKSGALMRLSLNATQGTPKGVYSGHVDIVGMP